MMTGMVNFIAVVVLQQQKFSAPSTIKKKKKSFSLYPDRRKMFDV